MRSAICLGMSAKGSVVVLVIIIAVFACASSVSEAMDLQDWTFEDCQGGKKKHRSVRDVMEWWTCSNFTTA